MSADKITFSFGRNWEDFVHSYLKERRIREGYPYEYASAGEVFNFCKKEFGFTLENLKTVNSLSLNEFLFRKPE